MKDFFSILHKFFISVSLSQTPPARSSISESRPFPLEWQSCHALSYIVKPRIHTVFRPIEIVALPFSVYRFTVSIRPHIQCDSIIMDHAKVGSIPEIQANHVDAAIVHEAAIGRINDEQLLKLRTLGMTEAEAENVIIENFLS